jgi:hypothetical protein
VRATKNITEAKTAADVRHFKQHGDLSAYGTQVFLECLTWDTTITPDEVECEYEARYGGVWEVQIGLIQYRAGNPNYMFVPLFRVG